MASARELQSLISSAKSVDMFVRQYQRAVERIVAELAAGVSRPGGARAAELIRNLNEIIDTVDPRKASAVRAWIRREIPRAFVLGDRAATRQLREAIRAASPERAADFGPVSRSFTVVNGTALRAQVSALIDTTARAAADMRAAVGSVVRRTQTTLIQSQAIREATASGIIRGATGRQVADDIASILLRGKVKPDVAKRLREIGFRGDMFDDFERIAQGTMIRVGARRMSVRSYANLVAQSQMREAHSIGTVVRLQQHGVNHVQVSRHIQRVLDECTPIAGNVFYIGPEEKDPLGFPKLTSIQFPPHPGCLHTLQPWVAPLEGARAIAAAKERSDLVPRRFFGKTSRQVRELMDELTPHQIEELFPQGASDIKKPA